jgi:hypothetical protein
LAGGLAMSSSASGVCVLWVPWEGGVQSPAGAGAGEVCIVFHIMFSVGFMFGVALFPGRVSMDGAHVKKMVRSFAGVAYSWPREGMSCLGLLADESGISEYLNPLVMWRVVRFLEGFEGGGHM